MRTMGLSFVIRGACFSRRPGLARRVQRRRTKVRELGHGRLNGNRGRHCRRFDGDARPDAGRGPATSVRRLRNMLWNTSAVSANATALRQDSRRCPARPDFRLYHGNDLEVLAGLLAAELREPVPGPAAAGAGHDPDPAAGDAALAAEDAGGNARHRRQPATSWRRASSCARRSTPTCPAPTTPAIGGRRCCAGGCGAAGRSGALQREPVFAPLQRAARARRRRRCRPGRWPANWPPPSRSTRPGAATGCGAGTGAATAGTGRPSCGDARRAAEPSRRRLDAYLARFDGERAAVPHGLPPRVFAFASQNVSPDVLRVIATQARAGTLHFYFLSPVARLVGRPADRARSACAPIRRRRSPTTTRTRCCAPMGAAGRDFVRTCSPTRSCIPRRTSNATPIRKRRTTMRPSATACCIACSATCCTGARRAPRRSAGRRRDDPEPAGACLPHAPARGAGAARPAARAAGRSALRSAAAGARDRRAGAGHRPVRALRRSGVRRPGRRRATPFPFALADGSAIASEPVAEVFCACWRLPISRFGVNEVLDLLAAPAIAEALRAGRRRLRRAARLAAARPARAGAWMPSTARATTRRADDAFTWAWALDRLLLGHASGERRRHRRRRAAGPRSKAARWTRSTA